MPKFSCPGKGLEAAESASRYSPALKFLSIFCARSDQCLVLLVHFTSAPRDLQRSARDCTAPEIKQSALARLPNVRKLSPKWRRLLLGKLRAGGDSRAQSQ
jgi:hypothetical protein